MKLWQRLFAKSGDDPAETTAIAAAISPLLDEVAQRVFMEHHQELMARPIQYVVPAVWGARKEGPLDETQSAIHQLVLPVVESVLEKMRISHLSGQQRFAVNYLVRGLIINRITYIIEAARNQGLDQGDEARNLADMEPLGQA